jgi:hypothetical protein
MPQIRNQQARTADFAVRVFSYREAGRWKTAR